MKAVYLVLLLVTLSVAVDLNQQLERDEIINAVNSGDSTWTAGRNFDPNFKKNYVKHLLGTLMRPEGSRLPALVDDGIEIDVPNNFDAREKWSKCISLQEVRDQGPCGSCWAVGAAAAFTDRCCIASKTAFNGHLSAEELLCCCTECGDGCNGGYPDAAWEYFKSNGIVTGGDYHSHEGCQPYTLPTCEHHVPGKRKNCSAYGDLPTPPCKSKCYNKKYKDHSFTKDHHKVKSTFAISNNVKQTQKEIFKNGPLEASFNVYEDFLSYKSGVYQHKTGDYLGGHAVKVIGWGVEKKVPYWLVANSWNSDWGDHGFFKIKRGNNECDFESDMAGGYPDV
uniref:Peptidase C1A papain C-terminal domain-containing protein n=1 Tax=Cuerna arida TaxID=1464854 RepID=A0A1B6FE67_9HEMI